MAPTQAPSILLVSLRVAGELYSRGRTCENAQRHRPIKRWKFNNMLTEHLPSATFTIIKILGHFKLDILEAKGNHFADILARNAALKGTSSSQTSVTGQRKVIATQSCPTLFNPMGWSSPGSFVHGILQARILAWVSVSFSKGSSQPRN